MKRQKGFGLIGIIIVVAIIAIAGAGWYMNGSNITGQPSALESGRDAIRQAEQAKELADQHSRQMAQELGLDQQNPTDAPVSPTADWKTYTNTEYGFEFKYPPTYIIDNRSGENFNSINFWDKDRWESLQNSLGVDAAADFTVTVYPTSGALDQEWANNHLGSSLAFSGAQANIGGRSWFVLECTELCGPERYVTKTTSYIIGLSDSVQILSTFKFLN